MSDERRAPSRARRPTTILRFSGSLRAASVNRSVLRTGSSLGGQAVRTSQDEGMRSLPHVDPDEDPDVPGYPGAETVEAACRRIQVTRSAVGPDSHVADEAIRRQLADALITLAGHAAATPTRSAAVA